MTDKEVLIKAVEHIENLLELSDGLEYYHVQDTVKIDKARNFIEWLKSISYEGNEEIQDMGQQGE